jgi:hypothetical protein
MSHLVNDPDFIGSRKVREALMRVINAVETSPSVAETSTAPSLTEVEHSDIAEGEDGDAASKAPTPSQAEPSQNSASPVLADC